MPRSIRDQNAVNEIVYDGRLYRGVTYFTDKMNQCLGVITDSQNVFIIGNAKDNHTTLMICKSRNFIRKTASVRPFYSITGNSHFLEFHRRTFARADFFQ